MKLVKKFDKKIIVVFTICMVFLISLAVVLGNIDTRELALLKADLSGSEKLVLDNNTKMSKDSNLEVRQIVYDGMTLNELSAKVKQKVEFIPFDQDMYEQMLAFEEERRNRHRQKGF